MFSNLSVSFVRRTCLLLWPLCFTVMMGGFVFAAEPTLVGALAEAVYPETSQQLKLSQAQLKKLHDLINTREEAGLNLALKARNMTAQDRKTFLSGFREESETLGFEILAPEQKTMLLEIYQAKQQADEETKLIKPTLNSSPPSPPVSKPIASSPLTPTVETPTKTTPQTNPPLKSTPKEVAATPAIVRSDLPPVKPGFLRFNFRSQPWAEVLDWFAKRADLALMDEVRPAGTFNYVDPKQYTPDQALDLINSVLLVKGYTLVRRERMLFVVNLENAIPANLVREVTSEMLPKIADYELVRVLFQLQNSEAELVAEEVQKLIGPQGKVIVLSKARQLHVTEVGSRLRAINKVIQSIENPELAGKGLKSFALKKETIELGLPAIRSMMGINENQMSTPTGSLRIAVDKANQKLLAIGTPGMLLRLEKVLNVIDSRASNLLQEPNLFKQYDLGDADPESVLPVLQTILAGKDIRLGVDAMTGNLFAFAKKSDHLTIETTIDKIKRNGKEMKVIMLRGVNPGIAVLAINKLFGILEDEINPRAPTVDADPISRQLFIRGTQSQITQIETLLDQMGNNEENDITSIRSNVRNLNLTQAESRAALQQIEPIWPSLYPNAIKVVIPSDAEIETVMPNGKNSVFERVAPGRGFNPTPFRRPAINQPLLNEPKQATPTRTIRDKKEQPATLSREEEVARIEALLKRINAFKNKETPASSDSKDKKQVDAQTAITTEKPIFVQKKRRIKAHFVVETKTTETPNEAADPEEHSPTPLSSEPQEPVSIPGSPITIVSGKNGMMIASDDLDALDKLEDLLLTMTDQATTTDREFVVYYLKYSKSEAAAAILEKVYGSGKKSGGIMSSMADAAIGGLGGGLVGDLLGIGGGDEGTGADGFASVSVDIIAYARLNAIIVMARSEDHAMVKKLLKVIDQRVGPAEVETASKPRMIQVYHAKATDLANSVKQIYKEQMAGSTSQKGSGQPNPEQIMRAMMQNRGGKGKKSSTASQEIEKMTISVNTQLNALIVRAPDHLFNEVKAFVEKIDLRHSNTKQSVEVISLRSVNMEAVQQALTSVLGDQVVSKKTSGSSSSSNRSGSSKNNNRSQSSRDDLRQRMMQEFRRGGRDRRR